MLTKIANHFEHSKFRAKSPIIIKIKDNNMIEYTSEKLISKRVTTI